MQPGAAYGTESSVGDLADQVVPEPDGAAVLGPQQTRGQRSVETLVDGGQVELSEVRDVGGVDDRAEHGGDEQHVLTR